MENPMEFLDYQTRSYLSAIEASKYLQISVDQLHLLVQKGTIKANKAASGQMRFNLSSLQTYNSQNGNGYKENIQNLKDKTNYIEFSNSKQTIIIANSMQMQELNSNSVHLMITSPPYFNTKMYSSTPIENDLGDVHDLDDWFEKISAVWKDVFRVLQPGRKAFINIMNLPVRFDKSFKTLNLTGRTIDICEKIGFVFKRDIVWHKTNGTRAHFGTYPYPGGILINNMHEFILEFSKTEKPGSEKYKHLTQQQKEESKIDKEFWLSVKNTDVWTMKPQGSGDRRTHIAPFPYELPYKLIKAFSYIGETILDPFAGSGTTLLAASDLKRNGIGYEINPEIAADAVKNLRNKQENIL